jgi:hypothetical protein
MDAGTQRPQHIAGVRWVDIVIEEVGHRARAPRPLVEFAPDMLTALGPVPVRR